MKKLSLLTVFLLFATNAFAIKLSDYTPYDYEVLFTNPTCKTYYYDEPMDSNSGDLIEHKPKNAYCKSGDSRRSVSRSNSPHKRLVQWIRSSKTKEIFMAYLSFSKGSIAKELCNAIERRNVKVTLIIDKNNESEASRMKTANKIKRCKPRNVSSSEANMPVVVTRGGSGSGSQRLGYAHNKLTYINPNQTEGEARLVFSSGNMSSGIATHHENWHFVTTNSKSYFAQIHRCLMTGMLDHYQSKKAYSNYVKSCRRKIKAKEESDIKVYFVPGDGSKATSAIKSAMSKSKRVYMAAHRFSYGKLVTMLKQNLRRRGTDFRMIVDDDMYWTGRYRRGMGRNSTSEQRKLSSLERAGLQVQYMETYADDVSEPKSMQLQHNKFLVFSNGSVFCGAGNLTTAAFTKNFENFYLISIPSVYRAFTKQYDHMWDNLTTAAEDMPTDLVLP